MKKEIIALGDIEMGGGTLTDDFISDNTLSNLIKSLSKRKHPIDLIFNGDTFDFLKCPSSKGYTRYVTEEVSLDKLDKIYKTHSKVFKALEYFVKNKDKKIYFIIGNHDMDLLFQSVQDQIKILLKNKSNIFFKLKYSQNQIYAEHGNQYDLFNQMNTKNYLIMHRGQRILNMPWVSFGIITQFLSVKEKHPFLERITPIPKLFEHHKKVSLKIKWHSVSYLFKSLFYYPLRALKDPTYFFPSKIFRDQLLKKFRKGDWEIESVLDSFKKIKKRIKHKIIILSHNHRAYIEEKDNHIIIHPDTWRDEYYIEGSTAKVIPKKKNYVSIQVLDDDQLKCKLVTIPRSRHSFNFKDISQDEILHLKLAAKAEGFKN